MSIQMMSGGHPEGRVGKRQIGSHLGSFVSEEPYLYRGSICRGACADFPASLGPRAAVAGAPIFGHMSAVQNEIAHPDALVRRPGTASFWLRSALTGAAFLAAYVILEWVSFIHEYKGV